MSPKVENSVAASNWKEIWMHYTEEDDSAELELQLVDSTGVSIKYWWYQGSGGRSANCQV